MEFINSVITWYNTKKVPSEGEAGYIKIIVPNCTTLFFASCKACPSLRHNSQQESFVTQLIGSNIMRKIWFPCHTAVPIQIGITGKRNDRLFSAARRTMCSWLGAGLCCFLGLSPQVVVSNPGDGTYST